MDSHGNIIFRAHLGAQDDPRLLVIDDPDPHLLVAAFYEPCLLPVFIVGRSRLIAKFQRPFKDIPVLTILSPQMQIALEPCTPADASGVPHALWAAMMPERTALVARAM